MKFHELQVTKQRRSKRVGRGISAGGGKTAGRGTKGQGARTGSKKKPGFAGGANPLMQQLPKLGGFKSHRTPVENVNLNQLNTLKAGTVTAETLAEAGLISNAYVSVKVLSTGELGKKLTVKLPAASANAIAAIESAGGSFEQTARRSRSKTTVKKEQ